MNLVRQLAADFGGKVVMKRKKELLDMYTEELQEVCVDDAVLMQVYLEKNRSTLGAEQAAWDAGHRVYAREVKKVREMLAEV